MGQRVRHFHLQLHILSGEGEIRVEIRHLQTDVRVLYQDQRIFSQRGVVERADQRNGRVLVNGRVVRAAEGECERAAL